jgi:WD40 repeat protein
MWHETGHRSEVTSILDSPRTGVFAVGYNDGSIRLWDAAVAEVIATFNGHKNAVVALAFDKEGTRLASGSKDTDIILWDVVAESGILRYDLASYLLFCRQYHYPQAAWTPRSNYWYSFCREPRWPLD